MPSLSREAFFFGLSIYIPGSCRKMVAVDPGKCPHGPSLHSSRLTFTPWDLITLALLLCVCSKVLFHCAFNTRGVMNLLLLLIPPLLVLIFFQLLSDAETLRWLNHAVEKVWPMCMEQIASQRFLLPIVPWFLEKYKPWTAVRTLNLSSSGHRHHGLKALLN